MIKVLEGVRVIEQGASVACLLYVVQGRLWASRDGHRGTSLE